MDSNLKSVTREKLIQELEVVEVLVDTILVEDQVVEMDTHQEDQVEIMEGKVAEMAIHLEVQVAIMEDKEVEMDIHRGDQAVIMVDSLQINPNLVSVKAKMATMAIPLEVQEVLEEDKDSIITVSEIITVKILSIFPITLVILMYDQ